MKEADFKHFRVLSPRKLRHLYCIYQSVEGICCYLLREPNETPKCYTQINLYLLNVKEEYTCRYNSPFKDKILNKYKGFLLYYWVSRNLNEKSRPTVTFYHRQLYIWTTVDITLVTGCKIRPFTSDSSEWDRLVSTDSGKQWQITNADLQASFRWRLEVM